MIGAWWVSYLGDMHMFKASVLCSVGDALGLIGNFHKLVPVSRPPDNTSLFL